MFRHATNALSILIALLLAGALACGCAKGSPPPTDEPSVPRLSVVQEAPVFRPRAEASVIAAWTFEPGAGWEEGEPPIPLPIVCVMNDGRVRMSQSLFTHSFEERAEIEGWLTPEQLERFKNGLTKMTDGLSGQEIERAIAPHFSYHQFTIDLPGRERTTFQSSFRWIELSLGFPPRVYWARREGWNRERDLSRLQQLSQNYDPAEMAIRETFIAVEAEFLRAAAQALINRGAGEGLKGPATAPATRRESEQ